jgi:hypothetical protein
VSDIEDEKELSDAFNFENAEHFSPWRVALREKHRAEQEALRKEPHRDV